MSTVTCAVGPHSVSEHNILGFEGGKFMPDTFDDIPFTMECVVALIFKRNSSYGVDGNEVMSDRGGHASWNTWMGQALVLVETKEEGDGHINNGDEKTYRRCGLLCVPEKSLGMFGEEEVVLNIV